ncbi:hypothetical protein SLV14_003582 [Streptomyces sp. Je 1-4]|nr:MULTISPECIES: hypothetical protein [unclassified Streptomyces]UYB40904.1 hypothetical protein SLV14_003582 [Streptomyces sp. Je 1-4]UZQ37064.1 hypothetical protein SLV14N_003582 [Streptomyces sp. Je 1-4] [Streptomyces sp. Je 1-4 4N24]UZQ44481.1 hypothetical protein SLV14NA_003582 [Streptomyces sp. Je 1-4] [Streptomyces sp. Je 1-4 4N24_ara]
MANTYETPHPDSQLDGFEAATEQTVDAFYSVTLSDDVLLRWSAP